MCQKHKAWVNQFQLDIEIKYNIFTDCDSEMIASNSFKTKYIKVSKTLILNTSIKRNSFQSFSIQTQTMYNDFLPFLLPINGLEEVIGIISETVFRKIVRDNKIVTPEKH